MHINTQISRGMERLITRREGTRLEGMFGLSGLSNVQTFGALHDALDDAGFVGARKHVSDLRSEHAAKCDAIRKALPVAIDAKRLMEENGSDLAGIFSKIGKALKKVAKTAVKLDPGHMIVRAVSPKLAAKIDPLVSAPKPKTQAAKDAAAAKKAARAAAKQAKKDAKAAAALAKANADRLAADQAAAAVLAQQSGVNLATPEAQAYAQQLVASGGGGGGGGVIPSESMFNAPADGAADDGTIFGMSPLVAAGAGAAVLVGGYLLFRKRR